MARYWIIIALIALPLVASTATELDENDAPSSETVAKLKCTYQPNDSCLGQCSWWKPYQRLPHTDCHKFCRCIFGCVKEKTCEYNYVFSVSKGKCVDPSSSSADCATKTPSCIGKCPPRIPANSVVLLQHDDCKKFCICKVDSVLVVSCPGDFIFDDKSAICRSPTEAKCIRPNSNN